MGYKYFPLALGALIASTSSLSAAYTFQEGKIIDSRFVATMTLEEHYNAGVAAMEVSDWREAALQFGIAAANFPLSPYGQEAMFFQGVANFELTEYDLADQAFSDYLQGNSHPRLFEEAIQYKFAIAENFRGGARRRLLGTKQLPKWAPSDTYAIKVYEEIIAAVPCHDLAVKSLFSKGLLHHSRKEFSDAVECFQTVTRRFPRHELTPECYLKINQIYLDQSRLEFQNPDILAFAEINVRRFEQNFPREERLEEARSDVLKIKEVYARGLYNTGHFYERIGSPDAAALYYRQAIIQFPETIIANWSNRRLAFLGFETIEPSQESCLDEVGVTTPEIECNPATEGM